MRALDPINVAVGAELRRRRELAGLTQAQLADHLRVRPQQVSKYEQGEDRIAALMLVRAGRALGCRPGEFFPASLDEAA